MEKVWEIVQKCPNEFKKKFLEINPIILQLLFDRNLDTQKKIDKFLSPDYKDLYDPFLLQDMQKAVDRFYQAIKTKEKIVICGDYDVDGITSSAILLTIFEKLGAKNINIYIPDREIEGYGVSEKMVKKFIKEKVNLIITCDCGITNLKEIDLANQAGIEVIVTDHHCQGKELPKALAIVNPQVNREKYPFKTLAGVGVAFKFIQALLSDSRCKMKNKESTEKWLLDLVALGTVADYMPLLDENRILVKYGLIVLNKTTNLGIKSLVEKSGLELGKLNTGNITFQLSPRINSAARIKTADEALKMILAKNSFEADEFAEHLNTYNLTRQQLVEKTIRKIKSDIGEDPKERILVVLGDWPKGVLGLCASRLLDKYSRPAIVLTQRNNEIIGSGRSLPNFNLHQALTLLKKYLIRFGGHPGAAGLTISPDKFEEFKKEILKIGKKQLKKQDLTSKIRIDAQVELDDIDWPLHEELIKFEPFGRDNWQPNLLLKNVSLKEKQMVGKNEQHCRLIIDQGKKMIYFRANHKMEGIEIGDKLDIVFQLDVNQWNGTRELQMKVIDLKKSK